MNTISLTPDQIVFWQWGFLAVNATILYTWLVMAFLLIGSWLITRRLSSGLTIPRWQNFLEVIIIGIRDQIREISRQNPIRFIPFVGTLFLFIAVSNLLSIVPGFVAPTGSLSTTAALSLCVFMAIPLYGIAQQGFAGYLKHYFQPTVFMFPFHLLGEISRTIALAVRLFGNVMSGTQVIAILLAIAPLFFPIVMHALELLIGLIQAYIFAVLAMVYIASAMRVHEQTENTGAIEHRTKGDLPHG